MLLRVGRMVSLAGDREWLEVDTGGISEELVRGNILFHYLGSGYMYTFSLCKFINCVCMICALLYMNVPPQKKSEKISCQELWVIQEKESLLLGCDGWGRPVLIRWHSLSLRKLAGHGVGRGVEVSGLQAECSRRASKEEWEGRRELEVGLSLKTRTWEELAEVVDV